MEKIHEAFTLKSENHMVVHCSCGYRYEATTQNDAVRELMEHDELNGDSND